MALSDSGRFNVTYATLFRFSYMTRVKIWDGVGMKAGAVEEISRISGNVDASRVRDVTKKMGESAQAFIDLMF